MSILKMCKRAKTAARIARGLTTDEKNKILTLCADKLNDNVSYILAENEKDVCNAQNAGIRGAFIDRLRLDSVRVGQMADGLKAVASFSDPIGEVLGMKTMPNGLIIGRKKVPLGVIGIIYESRPNVTADSFGLCLKSGNAVILRGGKESILSNSAIMALFRQTMEENGFFPDLAQLVTDTSRETAAELMKMNGYIDVLIPRGGKGLIQNVVENSTVPVIETGTGNCHIYVDESADLDMAAQIIINAKTSRPGVCNAAEKLLVHKNIAAQFLPEICEKLRGEGVDIRGSREAAAIVPSITPADDDDWSTEYADLIICVGLVQTIDEAVEHITTYSSGHSESIITESYVNAQRFLDEIDSAAVYVNASTRFTDGGEFGLGAEIGISTQKLHARGPMGLNELTSTKYIIYGNGQIR